MKRSSIRKHAFRMLFRMEFHEGSELDLQDMLYFEDIENTQISDSDRESIQNKVNLVRDNITEIDKKISEISSGWDIDRIGKVELTVLRLAVSEILYDDDIPLSVAINEAVEISKTFGGDSTPAFVNAVLAKLG